MTQPRAMIDRLSRFVRVRRAAFRIAAAAIAAVIVLELVGLAAWRLREHWRLGRIELTNEGPPLIVQVLDESGEHPVDEPFDLVAKSTLALPDGDYRLRVDGVGRLGRTYRLAVNRGETIAQEVTLDDGRLLGGEQLPRMGHQETPKEEPRPFAPITVAMELTPGKSDLIEFNGQSVVRRDGRWGRPVWDTLRPSGRDGPLRDTPPWIRAIPTGPGQVSLVDPPPELNGDGVGDLVWVFHDRPSLLVQSGKHGSLLWNYTAVLDEPGTPRPDGPDVRYGPDLGIGTSVPGVRWANVLGAIAVADADRDDVANLIATVTFWENQEEINQRTADRARGVQVPRGETLRRRAIVAVSGRSGQWLWTYPIDRAFTGRASPDWPATLAGGRQSALIAVVDDQKWVGLDPSTGRPRAGPIDLGFVPVRAVQHADLDGDGEPEILALGPSPAARQQSLRAISSATGRTLWTATINGRFTPTDGDDPPSRWPWLFDLDGDGRTEVAVPDWGPMSPGDGYRGVRLIDGKTGRTRWIRPMRPETPAEDGLAQLADAPDLDGDGTRDLVAVSFFAGRKPPARTPGDSLGQGRLYVDALSGQDGHPLWLWNRELPRDRYTCSWPPRWWGRGPDGWPLLAVPIGGPIPSDMLLNIASSYLLRPVVHVLEGSTGRELNTALGLYRPRVADLDGDGIDDLWGEADGQLRAFRGQAPEAWRAIGRFDPAGDFPQFRPGSDLDGDGIGDALIGQVQTPGDSVLRATGSHTAVARSGRDGHLLWKTVLDAPGLFFDRDRGDSYDFATFPLPAGDLDGDGAPDVLVKRDVTLFSDAEISRPASLPLQALSGRTGRHLWSAGPLPLGFAARGFSRIHWQTRPEARIIEPGGAPDVVVRHCSPFVKPSGPPVAYPNGQDRLARISGRDGRVFWDIPLISPTDRTSALSSNETPPFRFGDLDGDGCLDVVIVVPRSAAAGRTDIELKAVSLEEGKLLWSHRLNYDLIFDFQPPIAVGDLDGDRRAEVLVGDRAPGGTEPRAIFEALNGRDGQVLWTYQPAPDESRRIMGWNPPCLVDLDGDGRRKTALIVTVPDELVRVVILDSRGRETVRWEFPQVHNGGWSLEAADLDGDGRDELMVMSREGLHVLGPDLKEMWSRPSPDDTFGVRHLPASSGRPGTLILPPALGLDGSTGRPLWAGDPGVWLVSRLGLLDAGDATRLPLWIGHSAGTTVCRSAMPVTPAGTFAPPRGTPVRPGLARDDPRWTRPLPWTGLTLGTVGPTTGLALVNAVVPFGILWLSARRRPWSVRLLMAMPIAATVPLSVFLTFEPVIPLQIGSRPVPAWVVFVMGTLTGLPIVVYAGLATWNLIRRRWRALAALFSYTIAASAVIGAIWLWVDRRAMPPVEHYRGSGWYLIVLPGAYVVGVVLFLGWTSRGIIRWIRRPRRPEVGTT